MARIPKAKPTAPNAMGHAEIQQAPTSDYRGSAESEEAIPDLATRTEAAPMPAVPVWPEFIYAWHINCWLIMDGRLVPSLRAIPLTAGVSNVRRLRDGRIDIGDMRSHLEKRGWRLIPHNMGPGGRSYMRRTETDPSGQGRNRKYTYHPVWAQAHAGSDRMSVDEAGYAAWCESLVDANIIPPCPLIVARGLEEKAFSRLARLQAAVANGAKTKQTQVDAAARELDVIRAHIDSITHVAPAIPSEPADIEVMG